VADVELVEGRWRFAYKDPTTGRRRYKLVPGAIKTKGGAREYARAFLVKAARREVGLEPDDPNPNAWTVGALMQWWFGYSVEGKLESAPQVSARIKHFKGTSIDEVLIERLRPADVERWMHVLDNKLSPASVNHLRGYLARAFNVAIQHGQFVGANPVQRVKKRKVSETGGDWLTKVEVRKVLEMALTLQPQFAGLYAAAMYTGMRKGELFALRWDDVHLERGYLVVARSHDRMTTKGGKGRLVDIPDELRPWLVRQKALKTRNVFPSKAGKQHDAQTRLDLRFRRCVKAAGITRHIRFHDTRHTFASLHLMQHKDLAVLQQILGHASVETTRRRYGHLSRDHVRGQMQGFTMADTPQTPRPTARPARKSK